MKIIQKADICFQCGKDRITINVVEEYINGSLVTTTQSVCSDPACQKRTENLLRKERERREEAAKNKYQFGNRRNGKD